MYLLQSFVDDVWMLEMVIGEEVKLIKEVSDVYARERVHLRERENTWESGNIRTRAHPQGKLLT